MVFSKTKKRKEDNFAAYDYRAPCMVQCDGDESPRAIHDISLGGATLLLPEKIPPDSHLTKAHQCDGECLTPMIEVRADSLTTRPTSVEQPNNLGICFEHMDDTLENIIYSWLDVG